MRTNDFSRTFLREGYDMSEVRAFLSDVERTIRGQASEPDEIVTARKAEEIEFSVKFRGFNMDQVDAEIDRLIGVLRGLDRDREWAAQREGEAGEEVSAAHAHEPAPASLTDSRSGPEAPAIPSAVSQAPAIPSAVSQAPAIPSAASQAPAASDIWPIAPETRIPRADSGDVPVSPEPPEALVVPAPTVDASAPMATDSLDVDRMLDRLSADPPIQTVVDQVAAEFGTQEAVDEILRSMTQSKEQ
ncbi:DivIVA domain-containing protein [Schaalia odontolytica]|uniref:DivIVA domain-containing protein n=1 Tax=Schaalia odontolytica TaxID=1660 RepID=UPI001D075ABD|nr:DivIVA domain-containing protein [Schaalia odontolytica]MCB6401118.1 DivIVA domain-containing protein [Schaalia odontolytica]